MPLLKRCICNISLLPMSKHLGNQIGKHGNNFTGSTVSFKQITKNIRKQHRRLSKRIWQCTLLGMNNVHDTILNNIMCRRRRRQVSILHGIYGLRTKITNFQLVFAPVKYIFHALFIFVNERLLAFTNIET